MRSADVVIAGGGIAGLLIASALSPEISVIVLEQLDSIPRNKYWLTDESSAAANPDLEACVERRYRSLDFVAYDGLTARVAGDYVLWNTGLLIEHLLAAARAKSVPILTHHRLYSLSCKKDRVAIRANAKSIEARLLVDCMGFGSPLVGAKGIADVIGYYIVYGREVELRADVLPVGLDNVIVARRPMFFELFPTSAGTAHAAIILPSSSHMAERSMKSDWNFIVRESHYRCALKWRPEVPGQSYFGIIPVGALRTPALDRVVFFGESGQTNPAASATGLTRMLRTFRGVAGAIEEHLRSDRLDRRSLTRSLPEAMSPLNRLFHECLFERILTFTSDDFRQLVEELDRCPDEDVNRLIFADFDFAGHRATPLLASLLRHPRSLMARTMAAAFAQRLRRWRLR